MLWEWTNRIILQHLAIRLLPDVVESDSSLIAESDSSLIHLLIMFYYFDNIKVFYLL